MTGPLYEECHGQSDEGSPGVAAVVRSIFAQPERERVREQLNRVCESLNSRIPAVVKLLEEAGTDILSHMSFPPEHWRQLHSTNPLERINREVKRRSNVAGIFPNREAVVRLAGALLMEQQDEWEAARRCFPMESMRKVPGDPVQAPELTTPAGV